jgi:hypothetical protein
MIARKASSLPPRRARAVLPAAWAARDGALRRGGRRATRRADGAKRRNSVRVLLLVCVSTFLISNFRKVVLNHLSFFLKKIDYGLYSDFIFLIFIARYYYLLRWALTECKDS